MPATRRMYKDQECAKWHPWLRWPQTIAHYVSCVSGRLQGSSHLLWIWRWCWRSPRWTWTADMSCRRHCLRWAAAWTDNRTSSPFTRTVDSDVGTCKAVLGRNPPSENSSTACGRVGSTTVPRSVTSASALHYGPCSFSFFFSYGPTGLWFLIIPY